MTPAELNRLRGQVDEVQQVWRMLAVAIDLPRDEDADVQLAQLAEIARKRTASTLEMVRLHVGVSALRKLHDAGLVTPRAVSP